MINKSTGKSYYNSKNINRKDQSNRLIISIRLIIRGKELVFQEADNDMELERN